jgi:hypothetical protein
MHCERDSPYSSQQMNQITTLEIARVLVRFHQTFSMKS